MFLDIIIIVLLAWGAYKGWTSGFLKQLVSLLGFLVGLFVANMLYRSFGDFLAPQLGASPTTANILAFIVIWVMVPLLLGMLVALPSKWMRGTALGVFNNILGLLVGVLKYLVLLCCLFKVIGFLGMASTEKKEASHLYAPVVHSLDFVFDEAVSKVASQKEHSTIDSTKQEE
ncbi:MAG: CvpA family protein [Bacteroidaceae bacterium]